MNEADTKAARRRYEAAVALHRQGRLAEAEQHYRAVRRIFPGHPGVLHGLGLIALRTHRTEEAVTLLQGAAAAAPRDPAIRGDLGRAYSNLGRYEDAADCFAMVLQAQPTDEGALMGLGDALGVLGRLEGARAAYDKLLAANRNSIAALFGIGNVAMQMGQVDEARKIFERAVALAPKQASLHRALAETGPFVEDDPRLAGLEALPAGGLSPDETVERHFALAKAYDDLKRFDEAFEHLKAGNAIKRRLVPYDEASVAAFFREIAATFSRTLMQARAGHGDPSGVAVFIVGMPRSGSTLVEQIIASHPAAFGAGELLIMNDLVADVPGYPAGATAISDDALAELGRRYVARVRALAPDARRIVDKLPANFRHLGLIHLALPNAKIIHVRRDPMDTCFSCYSKLFLGGMNFAYDLGELGRYHKLVDSLMAHWRGVLPPGMLLDVSYEALVGDFEAQAQRIVAFCGLDWDARCLDFSKTDRPVRTLSQTQVRQPLFASSIGRWRNYEKHLQPLIAALR